MDDETLRKRWPGVSLRVARAMERQVGALRDSREQALSGQPEVLHNSPILTDEQLLLRWPGEDLQTAKFLERNFGASRNRQEQAVAGQPKLGASNFRRRKTTLSTFKKVVPSGDAEYSKSPSVGEEECHVCGGSGRHNHESGDIRCSYCRGKGSVVTRKY